MKQIKLFVSAILAGICIGIGGIVFLSLENKLTGALFFTVGLFTICSFGFHLFTGKICYLLQEKSFAYAKNLVLIWFGNLAGTAVAAFLAMSARIAPISEKARAMCEIKQNDSLASLFILGFFCNIMIYIAVDGFKNIAGDVGKHLALLFGVMVFILCGFEHCIADMFYFWIAGAWNMRSVVCILVITAGNAAGGIFISAAKNWLAE